MFAVLAAALLGAAPAPKSIADYYALLVAAGKVAPALKRDGSAWRYVDALDELPVEAKAAPVVDGRNGYLKLAYGVGPCDAVTVEVALFTAEKGRRFVAVGTHRQCIERDDTGLAVYELEGATFTDAWSTVGDLKGVTAAAFFDATPAVRAELEAVQPALQLDYELPRKGLTVVVRLRALHDLATGEDQTLGPRAEKLLAGAQRFGAVELDWQPKEARFAVKGKRPR